ncbi:MAG: carbohydrate-binding protein, partial [Bacteroidetes bacterium]
MEIFDGDSLIGEILQAPYAFQVSNLAAGTHGFYAKLYDGDRFQVSNLLTLTVGEQLPYAGEPIAIPGTFQAGVYDLFEGGSGQGIAYSDNSPGNNGDFRENESVDVSAHPSEGATVGWTAAGEWMEYTIDVQQAGYYTLSFRYACGNTAGGGPFRLDLNGDSLRGNITVSHSGGWNSWTSKTVSTIPLKSGKQVLRLSFDNGEMNLGKLTFTYVSPLTYDQPVADAGENILVVLPQDTTLLNGSNSSDPGGLGLSYAWTQVYGPSELVFSDAQAAQPAVSALVEGVYLLTLRVDNGSYSDEDQVYLISGSGPRVAPKVSLLSPTDLSEFLEDKQIQVTAAASDLIGSVERVEFYA